MYGSAREEVGKFRAQELTQVRGQTFLTLCDVQLFFFLLFLLPTTFGFGVFRLQTPTLFLERQHLSTDRFELGFELCSVLAGVGEVVLGNRRLKLFPFFFEPVPRLLLLLLGFFDHAQPGLQVSLRLGGLTFDLCSSGLGVLFTLATSLRAGLACLTAR